MRMCNTYVNSNINNQKVRKIQTERQTNYRKSVKVSMLDVRLDILHRPNTQSSLSTDYLAIVTELTILNYVWIQTLICQYLDSTMQCLCFSLAHDNYTVQQGNRKLYVHPSTSK